MGMFDSVIAVCPKCGSEVEFQSKAGVCEFKRYSLRSVPPEIAQDVCGDNKVCDCGECIELALLAPIPRVQMVLLDDRGYD